MGEWRLKDAVLSVKLLTPGWKLVDFCLCHVRLGSQKKNTIAFKFVISLFKRYKAEGLLSNYKY